MTQYEVKKLPFYNDVVNNKGKIYQVGGAVRDTFLGKESKDLDIVINGIEPSNLELILRKYGKVDMVGASFGVIKFTPPNGEEIDIAITRTEKKQGTGYQGFEVNADHTLPIEKDLERRDFTINSMARDAEGNLIDPFGGEKDLNAKVIRLTNPKAFAEDPLRMLRAIQFASRFQFTIEPETFEMIKSNAELIAEISKERVLIEFEKIVSKGKPKFGAELLIESGLYKAIFGVDFTGEMEPFDYVTLMSEFCYWLTVPFTEQPDYYYKVILKGDEKTTKEISALAYLYQNIPRNDKYKMRWVFYNLFKISPNIFKSKFVYAHLNDVYDDFKSGRYPKSISELSVDGEDLMNLGLKGKQIGDALMKALGEIYSDSIKNDKKEILNLLGSRQNLNESNDMEKDVYFFDFDGTLIDSPLKEPGMEQWGRVKGTPYPHKGWWGREESLDLTVFDIRPLQDIFNIYKNVQNNPNIKTVLLTNRMEKLKDPIMAILKKHNITFDVYSFKRDSRTKGDRIMDIMTKVFPDIKTFKFLDDDASHFDSVYDNFIETDYDFNVYHVKDGKL